MWDHRVEIRWWMWSATVFQVIGEGQRGGVTEPAQRTTIPCSRDVVETSESESTATAEGC